MMIMIVIKRQTVSLLKVFFNVLFLRILRYPAVAQNLSIKKFHKGSI